MDSIPADVDCIICDCRAREYRLMAGGAVMARFPRLGLFDRSPAYKAFLQDRALNWRRVSVDGMVYRYARHTTLSRAALYREDDRPQGTGAALWRSSSADDFPGNDFKVYD